MTFTGVSLIYFDYIQISRHVMEANFDVPMPSAYLQIFIVMVIMIALMRGEEKKWIFFCF